MDSDSTSRRRRMRDYQQRRLMAVCGGLALLLLASVVAGPIVGTLLLLLLGAIVLTVRLVIGPLDRTPLGALLTSLRRRPWRGWDEVLDIVADRFDSQQVIRTTLGGERIAACLVEVTIDMRTLERIASSIGIGMAEQELTGEFVKTIQNTGARLAHTAPPRVLLRADGSTPVGTVSLRGDFRAPQSIVNVEDATIAYDPAYNATPKTREYETYDDPTIAATSDLELVFSDSCVNFTAGSPRSLTLGKSATCDVTLSTGRLEFTSRKHATISWSLDGWTLADTSSNGTIVNGTRVREPHLLRNGDRIVFGTREDSPNALVHLPRGQSRRTASTLTDRQRRGSRP